MSESSPQETGQPFTPDALDTIWTQTRGQPWLVNALASETCFSPEPVRAGGAPVTVVDILDAASGLCSAARRTWST